MSRSCIYPLLLAPFIVFTSACNSEGDEQATSNSNSAPIAVAGNNENVFTGVVVVLDGSGSSDPDGDACTYQWAFQSQPVGSTSTLFSSTLVNPSFTPDVDGNYVIRLVVNDGTVDSPSDTVTFTASTFVNSTPIADAGGDQNVITGSVVVLDGSGSSDPDGDAFTYQWTFQSQPAASTASLFSSTLVNPSFTPDVDGDYVIRLVVNDGTVDSPSDTVTITASAFVNSAPIADAGDDQNVFTGSVVVLDGSGSSDPDGDAFTYQWTFQSQPAASTASLFSSTLVNPSFTPDVDGDYVIRLVVNDATVDSLPDMVAVTAAPVGAVLAGRDKYDADCASCHAAGTYDITTGSGANDLYDKGELLISNISAYSPKKKTAVADLSPQEMLDLDAFLEDPSTNAP